MYECMIMQEWSSTERIREVIYGLHKSSKKHAPKDDSPNTWMKKAFIT